MSSMKKGDVTTYNEQYFEQNGQGGDRPAIRWYAQVCQRLLGRAGCDVFEYGCGMGWLLRRLQQQHNVAGYDLSDFCRQQSRQIAPQATIYDALDDVPHKQYDMVVSLHVLEHVEDPTATVAFLTRLLKPGGKLVFVVPANQGLGHRIKQDQWFAYRDDTHISLLPEQAWRKTVTDAGLRVVKEAGDGLWDPPYVKGLPRWLQLPLFGAPAAIQVYAGRGRLFLPPSLSECLIMVAEKLQE